MGHKSLLKQVDEMYVLATSLGELEERLEIAVGEAEKQDFTWSITKFFAGRVTNIVSGHQVTLDPSGKNPPQIGPDLARIEKLTHMQPHKILKSFEASLALSTNFPSSVQTIP